MVKFEKISLEEYTNYFKMICPQGYDINEEKVAEGYDNIMLPVRSTAGTAGYTFFTPVDIKLSRYDRSFVTVPTGIKLVTNRNDIALLVYPDVSFAFTNKLELSETVSVVNADSHKGDFEGHIVVRVRADEETFIPAGTPFLTGVLINTLQVDDDNCQTIRVKTPSHSVSQENIQMKDIASDSQDAKNIGEFNG